MGKPFEISHEAAVAADPATVWDAIATGPGIDSWFMGDTAVAAAETISTAFGGLRLEHTVQDWRPGERLTYEQRDPGSGRFVAYEFLIAGRSGGGAVLRAVTSGFLPGDDWSDEFEAMQSGLALFFATLVQALTHFPGRTARPVTVFGPPVTDWPRTHAALRARLGVTGDRAGDGARFTLPSGAVADGVVYHADAQTTALRTDGALLRFVQGYRGPLIAMHHLFDPDLPADETGWHAWLTTLED